jgi:hypothetical protein
VQLRRHVPWQPVLGTQQRALKCACVALWLSVALSLSVASGELVLVSLSGHTWSHLCCADCSQHVHKLCWLIILDLLPLALCLVM